MYASTHAEPSEMVQRPRSLKQFLSSKNVPATNVLPWVHSTQASNLHAIVDEKLIMATPCNVFRGEDLCYLFVGRPAYKFALEAEPSYWELPVVFVFRFDDSLKIKRIYPFDSGAFSRNFFPRYITMFERENYEISSDRRNIGRLISLYFEDEVSYWRRDSLGERHFRENHSAGPIDQESDALARLYTERCSAKFDDRSATIEVQLESSVALDKGDLLGVVVPDEYLRDRELKKELKQLTPHVYEYDKYPLQIEGYYGAIYDRVKTIYRKHKIKV